jgi:hypothetical protein
VRFRAVSAVANSSFAVIGLSYATLPAISLFQCQGSIEELIIKKNRNFFLLREKNKLVQKSQPFKMVYLDLIIWHQAKFDGVLSFSLSKASCGLENVIISSENSLLKARFSLIQG